MTTTVIIGDIHSRKRKLAFLLQTIGAMDKQGNRVPGFHIIQLGDAISAGYGMKEADFYEWLAPWIDEWLVGNHEAPVLWPYDDRFKFYGYVAGDDGEAGCDPELKVAILAEQERYKVATTVGDWLITHAGLHPRYQHRMGGDAKSLANELNKLWESHVGPISLHDAIGCPICDYSEGINMYGHAGGVLWLRWGALHAGYHENHVKQIVGHTPGTRPHQDKSGRLWNIDTPRIGAGKLNRADAEDFGGVAALVTKDNGVTMELVYEP